MAGLLPNRTGVPTSTKVAGAGFGLIAIVLVVLAATGVFSRGSNNTGTVAAGTAPSTSTGSSSSPTAEQYPFGKPSNAGYSVPPPPNASTLVPTVATRNTTRLYGAIRIRRRCRSPSTSGRRHCP
jgi:hypothetical protein